MTKIVLVPNGDGCRSALIQSLELYTKLSQSPFTSMYRPNKNAYIHLIACIISVFQKDSFFARFSMGNSKF